jgi:hypothetical protein
MDFLSWYIIPAFNYRVTIVILRKLDTFSSMLYYQCKLEGINIFTHFLLVDSNTDGMADIILALTQFCGSYETRLNELARYFNVLLTLLPSER